MVRGLALLTFAGLLALPLATADLAEGVPAADGSSVLPALEAVAADAGTETSASAFNFQGACVEADSPGTADSRSAPVVVDTSPGEDDHTGVDEVGGGADNGFHARACVIPTCSIVYVGTPWYDLTCVHEWTYFVCGSTCYGTVAAVERAVCSSACVQALATLSQGSA